MGDDHRRWEELVTIVASEKDGGKNVIDAELGDKLRAMPTSLAATTNALQRVEDAFNLRK
ncbi:unnamed protein product [Ectocarpus sp. 8 AP-2014]